VVKFGFGAGREFDFALDDLHPRRHVYGAPGCDLGPVGHDLASTNKKIISLEAFQSTPQARSRAYLNQQPCTELNQIYDDGQE
jgi:hypothetical protein